ncbi:MAG: hypothetical protein ACRCUT_07400 [Spirochaetota bacterium]
MARENFIPLYTGELADLLQKMENKKDRSDFAQFCSLVSSICHYRFHSSLEAFKEKYIPFDPDADKSIRTLKKFTSEEKRRSRSAVRRFSHIIFCTGNRSRIILLILLMKELNSSSARSSASMSILRLKMRYAN